MGCRQAWLLIPKVYLHPLRVFSMTIYGHSHILYHPSIAKRALSFPKHPMTNHPPTTSGKAQHLIRISKILWTIQGAIIQSISFQMKCSSASLLLCCLATPHSPVSLRIFTAVSMNIVMEHTSILHVLSTRMQPLNTLSILTAPRILLSKHTAAEHQW